MLDLVLCAHIGHRIREIAGVIDEQEILVRRIVVAERLSPRHTQNLDGKPSRRTYTIAPVECGGEADDDREVASLLEQALAQMIRQIVVDDQLAPEIAGALGVLLPGPMLVLRKVRSLVREIEATISTAAASSGRMCSTDGS